MAAVEVGFGVVLGTAIALTTSVPTMKGLAGQDRTSRPFCTSFASYGPFAGAVDMLWPRRSPSPPARCCGGDTGGVTQTLLTLAEIEALAQSAHAAQTDKAGDRTPTPAGRRGRGP